MIRFITFSILLAIFQNNVFTQDKDSLWQFKKNEQVASLAINVLDAEPNCLAYGGKYSFFVTPKKVFELSVLTGHDLTGRDYWQTYVSYYKTQYKLFLFPSVFVTFGASLATVKVTDNWSTGFNSEEYGYVKLTRIGPEIGIGSAWRVYENFMFSIDWYSRQFPIVRYSENNLKLANQGSEVDHLISESYKDRLFDYTTFIGMSFGYIW